MWRGFAGRIGWDWGNRGTNCGLDLHGLNVHQAIFLFFAAAVGGGINAVAGGGSFVAFPALLFTGVAPVAANATNTLALWIGTTASGGAYRKRLKVSRRVMVPLIVTSVVGGIAGAVLLIKTPAHTFLNVLPWLMLAATLLFAFGKHLTGRISAGIGHDASTKAVTGASIFELVVSVYGGYFGGGIGIMNLAMFAAMGMTDIHEMNALKVLLGGGDQRRGGGDVYRAGGDMVAAGNGDDGGCGGWGVCQRALFAEVAAVLDTRVGDCGGGVDDHLFFYQELAGVGSRGWNCS